MRIFRVGKLCNWKDQEHFPFFDLWQPSEPEPASGSDAFALETRADRTDAGWALTGRKFWITNGAEAGLFVVFANTDFAKGYKGITGFLVERDFPGFAVGKKENKLGIRASSTTELILEACRVRDGNH